MDIVSTKMTNTVSRNVPLNSHKKLRHKTDCYILNTVSFVIILLFIIAIICYHYANYNGIEALTI